MFSFKKLISSALAALLLAACGLSAAQDAQEPVTFTLTAPEQAAPGEAFTVDVVIGGGYYEAHSLFFRLTYNPEVMKAVSVAPGPVWNALPMDSMKVPNLNNSGEVNIGILCPTSAFTGTGVIITVTFECLAISDTPQCIDMSVSDFFYSPLGGDVYYYDFEIEPASIMLAEKPLGLPGDVDGDGEVTFLDITVLYLFLTGEGGIDEAYLANADYNADGEPSYADITDMYIALIG